MSQLHAVHPFPARMAPDIVSKWLEALPKGAVVLDPMCGSGVVLRQSLAHGHRAIGVDMDPLAVLMSRAWTSIANLNSVPELAQEIVGECGRRRSKYSSLPNIKRCPETKAFIEYWFAEPQRSALARISHILQERRDELPRPLLDALLLAQSRTIITKQAGASLAWDVSHSRPHKKIDVNQYDVYQGFLRAAEKISDTMDKHAPPRPAEVLRGDGRNMSSVSEGSIDSIVTSPPYLNAIDYLRGHKLALVWMGYTIPWLRQLRSGAVGTENTGQRGKRRSAFSDELGLESSIPEIKALPDRQRTIVHKYASDSIVLLKEFKRVLKPDGELVLVLADSVMRGVEVSSSAIFAWAAHQNGFRLHTREVREIPQNRRYLPINSPDSALGGRMRNEIIQVFRSAA